MLFTLFKVSFWTSLFACFGIMLWIYFSNDYQLIQYSLLGATISILFFSIEGIFIQNQTHKINWIFQSIIFEGIIMSLILGLSPELFWKFITIIASHHFILGLYAMVQPLNSITNKNKLRLSIVAILIGIYCSIGIFIHFGIDKYGQIILFLFISLLLVLYFKKDKIKVI